MQEDAEEFLANGCINRSKASDNLKYSAETIFLYTSYILEIDDRWYIKSLDSIIKYSFINVPTQLVR